MNLRPKVRSILAVTAAALSLAGVLAAPANATPANPSGYSSAQLAGLQSQIDAQLEKLPDGRQIGINQIAWPDGTVLTYPLPGEQQARAVNEPKGPAGTANCSFLWTCLYEKANYDGRRLTWSDCDFLQLASYGFQDQASSWHNNQSGSTRTIVYNYNGANFVELWNVTPGRSSYVGNANNDKADAIRVC